MKNSKKNNLTSFLLSCFILTLTFGCNNEPTKEEVEDTKIENKTEENTNTTATETTQKKKYLIEEQAFNGIDINSKLKDVKNLQKGILSTGDGDFEVYYLMSEEGEQIAYILPSRDNPEIIGSITVMTTDAATKRGISIGTSYGEAIKLFNSDYYTVMGSEIEGRTYMDFMFLRYRLDCDNYSYKVDKNSIDKNTEINEIIVMHRSN